MLTQKRLREIIHYDPETGLATYKIYLGPRACVGGRVGKIKRGSKRSHPYRYVRLAEFGSDKPFTHIVHLYMTGRWPADEMDHISQDTLDDRWVNLRESTRAQNEANRGARRNNKLGVKGVFAVKGGFFAKFWRGKHITVGTFPTIDAAKSALSAAMKVHDGEFFRA